MFGKIGIDLAENEPLKVWTTDLSEHTVDQILREVHGALPPGAMLHVAPHGVWWWFVTPADFAASAESPGLAAAAARASTVYTSVYTPVYTPVRDAGTV